MSFTTLLSTAALAAQLEDPTWVIVDCRFDLADPDWGEAQYRTAHIPGAVYAHLDRDLSGPVTGTSGRHPLPDMQEFMGRLSGWGIGPGTQVVAYDQGPGSFAARLWWMLHYLGHESAAVLDGGFARWREEERPVRDGIESRPPADFRGQPRREMLATLDEVIRLHQRPDYCLIDARPPERYLGLVEPLDPVAGHIPGAHNLSYRDNMQTDGTFLSPDELRARFEAILSNTPPTNTIVYCGSGVTACHNLLAMQHAGLEGARLYVGSWSEWCADPARPVARDVDP